MYQRIGDEIMINIALLGSIITIISAILWMYRCRNKLMHAINRIKPYRKIMGIHTFHLNHSEAMRHLRPKLINSNVIRIMNLKGYSIVYEADMQDTMLFEILSKSKTNKQVDILLHSPNSPALQKRHEELGEKYSISDLSSEQNICIKKIQTISQHFSNMVKLRFFKEPKAIWKLVIWDDGILVGWYDPQCQSHKGGCLELARNSILGRHFEKYYNSVWEYESISDNAFYQLQPIFPLPFNSIPSLTNNEDWFIKYYSRPPAKENAFVIFIGAGAATGKSTLAWQLAHILGVRSVISTDIVRQIIREEEHGHSLINAETWEAWKYVETHKNEDTLYEGLRAQAKVIKPRLISVIKHILSKGMTTIIEGIHILPDSKEIFDIIAENRHVVFFVDIPEKRLIENYEDRRHSTHMRDSKESFSSIEDRILLHKHIIQHAKRNNMPVVFGESWAEIIESARIIIMNQIT